MDVGELLTSVIPDNGGDGEPMNATTAASVIRLIETALGLDYDESGGGGAAAAIPSSTPSPTVTFQLRLYDVLIPLLGTFIIALNLAVVISSGLILKRGQQPRSTYLFLGNVAMSDLITGVAVLFGQFYPRSYRDAFSCAIQIGMIVSSTIASVYSVGLIAVDRFLYIVYGLQYQQWVYPNRARLLIGLTWILGFIIGFLPAMGWRGDTDNGRICWFIILAPAELVVLTTVIGSIPLLIVAVLYTIILYHALRKVMQLKRATAGRTATATANDLRVFRGGGHTGPTKAHDDDVDEPLQAKRGFFRLLSSKWKNDGRASNDVAAVRTPTATGGPSKAPSKWKAIKVVLFTTGSFFVTWVPYFVVSTMYVACDQNNDPQRCARMRLLIASPLAILGFTNSLLNPVIYAWWHNGFRETVRKMWRRSGWSCCTNGVDQSSATTSPATSSTSAAQQRYSKQQANTRTVCRSTTTFSSTGSETDGGDSTDCEQGHINAVSRVPNASSAPFRTNLSANTSTA